MPVLKKFRGMQKHRNLINFLDIGFEKGERLIELSGRKRCKEKRFMGIEVEEQKGRLEGKRNLKLVYGGALKELRTLPDNSVKIVNADFLFTDWRSSKLKGSKEELQEVAEAMKEIKRVLVGNGRFCITTHLISVAPLSKFINPLGFELIGSGLITEEAKTKTEMTRIALQGAEFGEQGFTPVRLISRKTA